MSFKQRLSSAEGIVRLKSFAIVFARISGWFQLLMFGESQSNIENCPICKKIGAGKAASQV
jgi:hypothetical protein